MYHTNLTMPETEWRLSRKSLCKIYLNQKLLKDKKTCLEKSSYGQDPKDKQVQKYDCCLEIGLADISGYGEILEHLKAQSNTRLPKARQLWLSWQAVNYGNCVLRQERTSLVVQWLRIHLAMQARGFNPWSGIKFSHAKEQLSPCESVHHNKRSLMMQWRPHFLHLRSDAAKYKNILKYV